MCWRAKMPGEKRKRAAAKQAHDGAGSRLKVHRAFRVYASPKAYVTAS